MIEHYELKGSGTPLVLLLPHSTGPNGRQALIDGLARLHTVVTYSRRGTNHGVTAPGELTMTAQAADVVELLGVLDVGQAHLVCHSTGCGIGLSVAAHHPERVTGLVLAAPWSHADDYLTAMQTLRKAAAHALDPEQYARFNAALLFPPTYRRTHAVGFAQQANEAHGNPQDAVEFARRLDAILAFDARPLWPAIRCSTLVMVAGDDQLMPPWFAAEAASVIRGAELVEFDEGGHMLPETRTDDFVAAVLDFLAQARSTGSGAA